MEIMELIRQRHSVRQYQDKKISADIREQLNGYAGELNREGDLNIQIIYDEPDCFNMNMSPQTEHLGRSE